MKKPPVTGRFFVCRIKNNKSFLITFASLLSVICLLVMGLFDYVWYNYRIFFLFWAVIAIGVACIRIGKKEMSRCDIHKYSNEYAASVDINVN